ncbi:MAG TPA: TetR/AcrR family transcriptional regulator [Mycobacteriales bacterium]|nr:TetR/AcrR family transcriptional regulator [Mycobacteriales bacterium]
MAGRPRNAYLDTRLLDATWSLLTSDGYDALTLTNVAAQAGAHRTDVYRRWSSKAHLVVDTLEANLPPISDVDTGSLRSDIRAVVADFAASWSSPWIDGLMGLAADVQRDPDAELAFRQMAERRGAPVSRCIARALDRGELTTMPDLPLLGDLIEGPLMHRRMVGRQLLTPEYLDAVAAIAYRVMIEGKPAR